MPKSKGDTTLKKGGRRSGEELTHQVALTLKHIQELEYLEESPLARLPAVRALAEEKYRGTALPTGFALRVLLVESAKIIVRDLRKLPGYQREIKFLIAYLDDQSVVKISRSLGLSREHVARSIQPRVIGLVARVFLAKAVDQSRVLGVPTEPLHHDPLQ